MLKKSLVPETIFKRHLEYKVRGKLIAGGKKKKKEIMKKECYVFDFALIEHLNKLADL